MGLVYNFDTWGLCRNLEGHFWPIVAWRWIQASLQARRASKRLLEQWLAISPSESTPWGVPGRMENGQMLQKNFTVVRQSNWSTLSTTHPSQLPTRRLGYRQSLFLYDVGCRYGTISPCCHHTRWTSQFNWTLVRFVSTTTSGSSSNRLGKYFDPSSSVVPNESQTPVLTQPVATVENISLPTGMIEMARSFHLPLPQGTIPPEISTLAAWTKAITPSSKKEHWTSF